MLCKRLVSCQRRYYMGKKEVEDQCRLYYTLCGMVNTREATPEEYKKYGIKENNKRRQ